MTPVVSGYPTRGGDVNASTWPHYHGPGRGRGGRVLGLSEPEVPCHEGCRASHNWTSKGGTPSPHPRHPVLKDLSHGAAYLFAQDQIECVLPGPRITVLEALGLHPNGRGLACAKGSVTLYSRSPSVAMMCEKV